MNELVKSDKRFICSNRLFVNTDARSVLHNIMPCCISHPTPRDHSPPAACLAKSSSLVLNRFVPAWQQTVHSTGAEISSVPAPVKDAPLLLGAGQGWAQTAGNHMTETVETAREAGNEKCMDWIPTGSEGLWGISEPWGYRWVSGKLSGEHQSFDSPDICHM